MNVLRFTAINILLNQTIQGIIVFSNTYLCCWHIGVGTNNENIFYNNINRVGREGRELKGRKGREGREGREGRPPTKTVPLIIFSA